MLTQATNPSNPEAVLLSIGERPSLLWLQFTIEEITPYKLKTGKGNANGSLSLFVKWASIIGWKPKDIRSYLGGKTNSGSVNHSIARVDKSDNYLITEADSAIEKMILG